MLLEAFRSIIQWTSDAKQEFLLNCARGSQTLCFSTQGANPLFIGHAHNWKTKEKSSIFSNAFARG